MDFWLSYIKLVNICEELIEITQDFNRKFLPIDYSSIQGVELDSSQAKYGKLLTKQEVLDHPAWLTAVEEDRELLRAYSDIVFAESRGKNMGFWVLDSPNKDQLRALFVYDLDNSSYASGYDYLDNSGSFLRVVAHQGAP